MEIEEETSNNHVGADHVTTKGQVEFELERYNFLKTD